MWVLGGLPGLLTTVGAFLVIGDNVLMALRLEPAADAEGVLGAADEAGVPVGVLAALVEHAHDLLAPGGRLRDGTTQGEGVSGLAS